MPGAGVGVIAVSGGRVAASGRARGKLGRSRKDRLRVFDLVGSVFLIAITTAEGERRVLGSIHRGSTRPTDLEAAADLLTALGTTPGFALGVRFRGMIARGQ